MRTIFLFAVWGEHFHLPKIARQLTPKWYFGCLAVLLSAFDSEPKMNALPQIQLWLRLMLSSTTIMTASWVRLTQRIQRHSTLTSTSTLREIKWNVSAFILGSLLFIFGGVAYLAQGLSTGGVPLILQYSEMYLIVQTYWKFNYSLFWFFNVISSRNQGIYW